MEHHKYGIFLIELKKDGEVIGIYESMSTMEFITEFETLQECREFQSEYSNIYSLKTIIIPVY